MATAAEISVIPLALVGSPSENSQKLMIAESKDCPPYVIEIAARSQ